MANYQKINTLFKRDEKTNNIILEEYSIEEFNTLKNIEWECTEKIDGTNIHIDIDWKSQNDWDIAYFGRTECAEIPDHLLTKLKEIFDNFNPNDVFEYKQPVIIQIFGEGYGKNIQKGGENYIHDGVGFILFDIRINNIWLQRDSLKDIANKMNLKIVPLIGYMTLSDAIDFVKKGFYSLIAKTKNYPAEGLVLKTKEGLLDRQGNRIITKLKIKDFKKLLNSDTKK